MTPVAALKRTVVSGLAVQIRPAVMTGAVRSRRRGST